MKLFGTPHIIETTNEFVCVCHARQDPTELILQWLMEKPLYRANYLSLRYEFARPCHRALASQIHSYFYEITTADNLIGKDLNDNQRPCHETDACSQIQRIQDPLPSLRPAKA